MYRTLEPLFLPQSPLVFVLAQVRIDPVLAVEKYIPEIQETLRKQGFPKLRTRENPFRFSKEDGQLVKVQTKTQWEFHDSKNQTSIMVDHDSIVIQTTAYKRFEEFEELIRLALKTTSDAMRFSQVTRCGLRYIDAIDRPESRDWSDVLLPSLLGMPTEDGIARESSLSQTDLLTREGSSKLRVRCLTQPQGLVIPPELIPCELGFLRPPRREDSFATLDFDHFTINAFDFELEATLNCLGELHDILDQSFRRSVSPTALQQWKQPKTDS